MSKTTHIEAGKLGYKKAQYKLKQIQQDRIYKYKLNPKICKHCGKPIPYEKRKNNFCNQSCSASYNNRVRIKKPKNKCLYCGKELKGSNTKYCNNRCQNEYQYIQYIQRWKEGKETGLKGRYNLSNYIKRYLLEKANYHCEQCGWGEINSTLGHSPLEIHHIDGDYTNNKEENLIVLCPNCHSLTPNYKAMNKNGRKDRKIYNKSKNKQQ